MFACNPLTTIICLFVISLYYHSEAYSNHILPLRSSYRIVCVYLESYKPPNFDKSSRHGTSSIRGGFANWNCQCELIPSSKHFCAWVFRSSLLMWFPTASKPEVRDCLYFDLTKAQKAKHTVSDTKLWPSEGQHLRSW